LDASVIGGSARKKSTNPIGQLDPEMAAKKSGRTDGLEWHDVETLGDRRPNLAGSSTLAMVRSLSKQLQKTVTKKCLDLRRHSCRHDVRFKTDATAIHVATNY